METDFILRLSLFIDDETIRPTDYYVVSQPLHQRMLSDFDAQVNTINTVTDSEAYTRQYIGSLLTKGGKFYRALTANSLLEVKAGTAYVSKFDPDKMYNDEDIVYLGGSMYIRRAPGKGNFVRTDWVLLSERYKLTDVTYYADLNPSGYEETVAQSVIVRAGAPTTSTPIRPKDTDPETEALLESSDGLGELFDTLEIHSDLEIHL